MSAQRPGRATAAAPASVPPARRRRQGEERIASLPNAITVVRLVLTPVFGWLLAQPHERHWLAAATVLAVAGATDWLDGQVARRFDQVTTVGKVIDPVADRLLLATAVIGILAVGAVPTVVAALAIAREATVALTALVLASLGARRIDVTYVGKAGTFGLMVAFPSFLTAHSPVSWRHDALVLAWVAAVAGLVLGWVSAAMYVPLGRRALAEGRAGKSSAAS
ncbi:MAG TPA: CDP-alcohol phosphatidyltransferase family protein [Acidimicrobiales bacterium]|nr:CDP-alcohol phosphatidyltransferase family protein [Acidimicrobiales bacterium]